MIKVSSLFLSTFMGIHGEHFNQHTNMAKSQATFSKKEKEKKRLAKRKEKEEKWEEKKANATKKSFEDMIAYVDENGRITSTPPEKKKQDINLEDIQLGARKEEPVDPADLIRKGTVSYYNDQKGYGFIRDEKTQQSIFFHVNGVVGQVKERDKVSFEIEMGPKGPNGVRVTVVK